MGNQPCRLNYILQQKCLIFEQYFPCVPYQDNVYADARFKYSLYLVKFSRTLVHLFTPTTNNFVGIL